MKKESELKGFAYSSNGVGLSSLGKKKKSVLSKKWIILNLFNKCIDI